MTEAELEELFKKLKTEVRKVNGVSGCGGNLSFPERKIIVHLMTDTIEVREAVLKVVETVIGSLISKYEVEWIHVGVISKG